MTSAHSGSAAKMHEFHPEYISRTILFVGGKHVPGIEVEDVRDEEEDRKAI